jgi:hypothetical protein
MGIPDQSEKLGARDKILSDQSHASADLIILHIICSFLDCSPGIPFDPGNILVDVNF